MRVQRPEQRIIAMTFSGNMKESKPRPGKDAWESEVCCTSCFLISHACVAVVSFIDTRGINGIVMVSKISSRLIIRVTVTYLFLIVTFSLIIIDVILYC